MKLYILLTAISFNFLMVSSLNAQQKTVQPKIMVIPFTKSGQEIMESYEKNDLQRLVIARVKTGFETRNFPTVDFISNMKMISNDVAMEIENQTSVKQQLIEISGADAVSYTHLDVYKRQT